MGFKYNSQGNYIIPISYNNFTSVFNLKLIGIQDKHLPQEERDIFSRLYDIVELTIFWKPLPRKISLICTLINF